MQFLRRGGKDSHDEPDEALSSLSSSARDVITGSKRARRQWRNLVAKVGMQSATEHAEVSALVGMIDATVEAVSVAMRDWRAGLAPDANTLQGLVAVETDTRARVGVAIEHVQRASSGPESLAITAAGPDYLTSMFRVATRYVTHSMTDAAGYAAMAAKQAWTDACDNWDMATGRSRLPLVGD